MSASEITAQLKLIADRLGPEGRASIVLASNSIGEHGFVYASIENTWRKPNEEANFRTETFEEAFAALSAWVDGAPLRNRVMTAADIFGEAA